MPNNSIYNTLQAQLPPQVQEKFQENKKEPCAESEGESKPFALFSSLPYYSILLMYIFIYWSVEYWGHPGIGAFIQRAVIIFGDIIIGKDTLNPTQKQSKQLADSVWFKIPLYVVVVADWVFFFWVIHHLSSQPFDLVDWIAMIPQAGFMISTNFAVAHELFHKHDFLGRFIGGITMTKMLYTHFFIEHQYGHHRHVATPNDPATSRFGETLYQFLPRTIVGSYLSAWDIEKRRLLEIEECSTHWHPKNRMIWYTLSYPAFLGGVYAWFGLRGIIAAALLAFVSVVLLEAINYVEHYGLERKEIAPGEYERVSIEHSWNAPQRLTNYLLFKLQRHSDHHENAYKPYQTLATYDKSPMLPNGYSFCIMLSFHPRFFFRIMNPMVMAYKKGVKLTEAEKLESRKWQKLFLVVDFSLLAAITVIGYIARAKFYGPSAYSFDGLMIS